MLATIQRDNMEAAGREWSIEEEAAFKQVIYAFSFTVVLLLTVYC